MSYRNQLDAQQAQIEILEAENKRLCLEIEKAKQPDEEEDLESSLSSPDPLDPFSFVREFVSLVKKSYRRLKVFVRRIRWKRRTKQVGRVMGSLSPVWALILAQVCAHYFMGLCTGDTSRGVCDSLSRLIPYLLLP